MLTYLIAAAVGLLLLRGLSSRSPAVAPAPSAPDMTATMPPGLVGPWSPPSDRAADEKPPAQLIDELLTTGKAAADEAMAAAQAESAEVARRDGLVDEFSALLSTSSPSPDESAAAPTEIVAVDARPPIEIALSQPAPAPTDEVNPAVQAPTVVAAPTNKVLSFSSRFAR